MGLKICDRAIDELEKVGTLLHTTHSTVEQIDCWKAVMSSAKIEKNSFEGHDWHRTLGPYF